MSGFNTGWYLIYIKPRQEKNVANHLDQKGINCFLPTMNVMRQWHDRKKKITVPLFPSYIFVDIQCLEEFYSVLDIDGVCCFVKQGKNAARVPESVIFQIGLLVNNGHDIEVSDAYFQTGQKLMIQDGPFTGLLCETVQSNGRDKILVRVDLLNRNLVVELPGNYLSKIA